MYCSGDNKAHFKGDEGLFIFCSQSTLMCVIEICLFTPKRESDSRVTVKHLCNQKVFQSSCRSLS